MMIWLNKHRKLVALLLALAAAFTFAGVVSTQAHAVTLVNAQGQPVGGQWQQWVNQMEVPTISGDLTFSSDMTTAPCGMGCSDGPYPGSDGLTETWVAPHTGMSRQILYFELGHQFDWRYLTPYDRWYLTWAMDVQPLPARHWWDTTLDQGSSGLGSNENGVESFFSTVYADCAMGTNDKGQTISMWVIAGAPFDPVATPRLNVCPFIDRVARQARAEGEQTAHAPWSRLARRVAHSVNVKVTGRS